MARNRFHRNRFKASRKPRIPWIWINILTILLIPIIMSFIFEYIPYNTSLMKSVSIILFIIMLYFVARAAYFLLRRINRINLMSDLSLWLLKIFSGIMFFVSGYFFFASLFLGIFMHTKNPYSYYSILLLSGVIFIISIFGLFRGKRRQTIIGVWG